MTNEKSTSTRFADWTRENGKNERKKKQTLLENIQIQRNGYPQMYTYVGGSVTDIYIGFYLHQFLLPAHLSEKGLSDKTDEMA